MPMRCRRGVLVVGALCFFPTLVSSIEQPARNKPADATQWRGRHFVWRVTNAPAPFYLIGSMHALRGPDYRFPVEIDRAIADARQVLFETDPTTKDAPLFQRKVMAAGYYPPGVTLEQKVSRETLMLLKRIARVRYSDYANRKPWAIAFFTLWLANTERPAASRSRVRVRRGLAGSARSGMYRPARMSMDRYIFDKARGQKEIGGLETVDEFIRAFSNMSDTENEAFLLETIAYEQRLPRLFDETTAAWKSGDTGRMYQLYAPRTKNSGYWRWVESRTSNWIPRIEQAIQSGKPTLVVAGALHFCGPRSVIALLQKRGYKVEQL